MNVIIKSILYLLFLSTYIINSTFATEDEGETVKVHIPTDDDFKDPKKLSEADKKKTEEEIANRQNDEKKKLEDNLKEKYNNNDLKNYQDKYKDYLKNFEKDVTVNKDDKVNVKDLSKNPDIVDYKLQQTSKSCC